MSELDKSLNEPYESWAQIKPKRGLFVCLLKVVAYLQITMVFGLSVAGPITGYLFSTIALASLACLLFDAYRKHGMSGLRYDAPIGFRYYQYHAALLVASLAFNVAMLLSHQLRQLQ